jgi:integrase
MTKTTLTRTLVRDIQPTSKDVIVWDEDVTGFALKVTPRGKKSFLVQYRTLDHVERKLKIGDCSTMKPDKARDIARDILMEVRKGGDPAKARKAKRASRGEGTLKELFDDYKAHKKAEGRRSSAEIERIFKHDILPEFGKRKPEEISTHEVSILLNKVAARSPSVAWAVRRQLSAFYSWAIPSLPHGTINPVTHASRPPKVRSRDRVLTNEELKSLWKAVDNERDPWRTALKLLILTGQRREEVLSADWQEFDLRRKVWTIPAVRAKNGKAHVVPLSGPVVKLLEQLPNRTGRLFPKGTGIVSRAAKRIRDAMGDVPHWTWHDLRRTVATGLQQLNVRLEVTEAILNHVSGSRAGIVGVYQRHDWADEKREALNKWAQAVVRIVSEKPQRRAAKACRERRAANI